MRTTSILAALFLSSFVIRHSSFVIRHSSFVIRHSSFVIRHSAFSAEGAKPNIVIIVADDLGYADVLFNPQHPKEVTTPNLDALAKQSVICRQAM